MEKLEKEIIKQNKQNLFEINQAYYKTPCIMCKYRFADDIFCNCGYKNKKKKKGGNIEREKFPARI
jgi:hypothetical protein